MKNLLKFLPIVAILAIFAASCNPDPCKDVVCGTQGACVEGTCVCNTGFEKDSAGLCSKEIRAKAIGTWTASDACSASGTSTYVVVTSNSSASNVSVQMANFWGVFNNAVIATVAGQTITIARQQPDNDNFFVEGSGTVNAAGTSITWTYSISDETNPSAIVTDNCTSTWTK